MKTGCMASQRSLRLATREDSGGARADSLGSFSFLSPTWLMTGLFPGVFLPSGQIAVGSSGAFFYELRYSRLENKQAANETFLWKPA